MERLGPTPTNDRSVSERVVDAVAEAEGVHPIELSTPLFEAVDPDALDALYRSASDAVFVSFRFCGHEVTVTGDGQVSVDGVGASAAWDADASMAPTSGETSEAGSERPS